jgi:hypothetical protein
MGAAITSEDARVVARILWAVHERRRQQTDQEEPAKAEQADPTTPIPRGV